MKKAVQFCFAVLAMFCPLAASSSRACQCRESQPVCAEYRGADVVFTGQVSKITRLDDGVRSQVTLRVERALKGMNGKSIELINWGTSCDYSFREGKEYLVYAFRNERSGELSTWECSRTRELAKASNDIAYIDGAQTSRTTVITGVLADGEKRLRSVRVIVKLGAHVRRLATDDEGWFKLNVNGPGKYVVQIYLPRSIGVGGTTDLMEKIGRYRPTRNHWIVEYDVEVKDGECSFIDVPLFIPRDATNVRIVRSE